jgi:hypothetical protein
LQQALSQYQRTNRRLPDQIVALAGLAQCAWRSGKLAAAARYATEATTLARQSAVPGQPSYWLGLSLLTQADVERALGHATPAHDLSVAALAQLSPTVGTDHPLTTRAAALARPGSTTSP